LWAVVPIDIPDPLAKAIVCSYRSYRR